MKRHAAATIALIMLLSGWSAGCKSGSTPKADADADAKKEATAETPDSSDETSAQEWFSKGNDHLDAGDWKKAIDAYQSAIDKNAERWDAYMNMAIAQSSNGQFEEAVASFEACIAHGGKERPEVYYNLGNVYQKRGLYEQAIKAYRTSLSYADDPQVDTLINIASSLTILGRKRDAKATYDKAQSIAPRDPRIQHGQAVLLHHSRKYQEALDAYEQLHSMSPDYAQAYFDKASVYVDMKNFKAAIDTLKKYRKVAPDGEYADKASKLIGIYKKEMKNPSPDENIH